MPAASGSHHNAKRLPPSHDSADQLSSKHPADARHGQLPAPGTTASSPVPSRASGTTTRLHHGLASRFASGPASDAWSNSTAVSGSSPTVATAWADRKPRSQCRRSGRHPASHATPAKLNQNPAVSIASGSAPSTSRAASASAPVTLAGRRPSLASAITATISTVRTVGRAKPATAA